MASNARRAANSAPIYQTLPTRILIILLTVGLALIALSSLDWPMRGDLPANLYVARLMGRHGYVPYRDFWSDSLPGAFLMYMAVGELGGYTNAFGLRLVDLLYLALLSAVTFRWLRKLGAGAAWAAPVIFIVKARLYRLHPGKSRVGIVRSRLGVHRHRPRVEPCP